MVEPLPTDAPAFVVANADDAAAIRARVTYEDGLLGSRSTLVLELNALAAVASGLTLPSAAKTIVVIAIVALDVAWIWGARESWYLVAGMTKQLAAAGQFAPVDERSRFAIQAGRRRWVKPTYMFACVVPPMLVLAWITAVVLVLRGQPFIPVAPPRPWLVAVGVAANAVGGILAVRSDTVQRRAAWIGVVVVGTILLVVAAVRP